jgi:hypothetical protein
LTLGTLLPLVKDMKLTKSQIERLVRQVLEELKTTKIMTIKVPEDKVFRRACELIEQEYEVESQLERQVNKMLDDLERQNPNGFQRSKMFQMLKKRLAQEKGIIL